MSLQSLRFVNHACSLSDNELTRDRTVTSLQCATFPANGLTTLTSPMRPSHLLHASASSARLPDLRHLSPWKCSSCHDASRSASRVRCRFSQSLSSERTVHQSDDWSMQDFSLTLQDSPAALQLLATLPSLGQCHHLRHHPHPHPSRQVVSLPMSLKTALPAFSTTTLIGLWRTSIPALLLTFSLLFTNLMSARPQTSAGSDVRSGSTYPTGRFSHQR